jgi:hypothetical protein
MADGLNPAAPHSLPFFIADAAGNDPMLWNTGIFLGVATLALGVIFFWLHALPERIAHKGKKTQMEVVTILCLLALFTHVHLFWIVALVLAVIDLPDLVAPGYRIAESLDRIGDRLPGPAHAEATSAPDAGLPEPVTPPAETRA